MTATPKKLRDGSWGALVQSTSVRPGDSITITSRAGQSWAARVARVLWRGDGVAIVATSSQAPGRRRSRRSMIDRDEMCFSGHRSPVEGCRDCFDTFDC